MINHANPTTQGAEGRRLLLDPGRRQWIVEQVERHGRSRKGLAAELNAQGVPTATGRGRWYPSTIAGVLASVAYERELHSARTRTAAAEARRSHRSLQGGS